MSQQQVNENEGASGDGEWKVHLDLGTRIALVVLVLIVVFTTAVLLLVVFSMSRRDGGGYEFARRLGVLKGPLREDRKPGAFAHLHQKTLGKPEAKVRVLAVLSLRTDCYEAVVRYLLACAKARPDHLVVRFVKP